jgi:2-methylcitrate dehydratase PrpD
VESGGLTLELARQARSYQYEAFKPDLRQRIRMGLLDFLGVSLAGSREPLARIVADECLDAAQSSQASVVGAPFLLSVAGAALVNGVCAHALDYDDVSLALSGHPSAVVLPAVLAMGEQLHASGKEVAAAYAAAFETACRVGRMLMPSSQELGFHVTGLAGAFGAAAGASRLLRLDERQTVMALGIASSQAAGLRVDGGTMCKPLHAGRAAETGVLAARLAQRGFSSRPDVMECERGFIAAYSREARSRAIDFAPGEVVYFPGSIFKFHAACFFVHAAIECGRKVRSTEASEIDSIELTVHPHTFEACEHLAPVDDLQSKRSLTHAVALGMLNRPSDSPDTFGAFSLSDPVVLGIRAKVKIVLSDSASPTGASLRVRCKGGETRDVSHDAAAPTVLDASTTQRLRDKYRTLSEPVLGDARATELMHQVDQLDEVSDVAGLMAIAAAPVTHGGGAR